MSDFLSPYIGLEKRMVWLSCHESTSRLLSTGQTALLPEAIPHQANSTADRAQAQLAQGHTCVCVCVWLQVGTLHVALWQLVDS